MSIDPLDLMDNDFSVINNSVTGYRNILRRGNLSINQAIEMAKMMTTKEVLRNPDKYHYEIDVYDVFCDFLLSLSLSQNAKSLDLLGKVYAVQVKDKDKKSGKEKLENE